MNCPQGLENCLVDHENSTPRKISPEEMMREIEALFNKALSLAIKTVEEGRFELLRIIDDNEEERKRFQEDMEKIVAELKGSNEHR